MDGLHIRNVIAMRYTEWYYLFLAQYCLWRYVELLTNDWLWTWTVKAREWMTYKSKSCLSGTVIWFSFDHSIVQLMDRAPKGWNIETGNILFVPSFTSFLPFQKTEDKTKQNAPCRFHNLVKAVKLIFRKISFYSAIHCCLAND